MEGLNHQQVSKGSFKDKKMTALAAKKKKKKEGDKGYKIKARMLLGKT